MAAVASLAIGSVLVEKVAADYGPTTDEVSVRGMPRELCATAVEIGAAEARRQAGTEGDPVKVIEDLPGTARLVRVGAARRVGRRAGRHANLRRRRRSPRDLPGSGLRSVLSATLVRDVTLSPGAYGVDYGRGIGGQLRLETKNLP